MAYLTERSIAVIIVGPVRARRGPVVVLFIVVVIRLGRRRGRHGGGLRRRRRALVVLVATVAPSRGTGGSRRFGRGVRAVGGGARSTRAGTAGCPVTGRRRRLI